MDRFDLCVLATGTIVIQPYMIYTIAFFAVAYMAYVAASLLNAWVERAKKERRAEKERQELSAEVDKKYADHCERVRLAKLYPEPWFTIYKDCIILTWRERIILFNGWIGQKGQFERLPRLSVKAIRELAGMVSGSSQDYARAVEKLSPYLALPKADNCKRHPDVGIINYCQCCPICCDEAMAKKMEQSPDCSEPYVNPNE